MNMNENFVVDKEGHKIGVFLDMKTYERIMEELEELEDIRAFDEAREAKDEAISFEQAIREIEQKRNS